MSCFLAFWTASIPEIRRSHTVWKIMDVCVGSEVIGKTDWPLVFKVFGYQGLCNTLKKSLWQMPSKKVIESVFFRWHENYGQFWKNSNEYWADLFHAYCLMIAIPACMPSYSSDTYFLVSLFFLHGMCGAHSPIHLYFVDLDTRK